ncbi:MULTISPECIES: hypothetical protein [unclassified Pseudonocardia]|uniref:HAAS signaling domain-containing protein n=1 Tax=unclassified Pseudonocardia TaxID=2619320 RepID=UPI00094B4583|nr:MULTISPECIES: hypothetical protein [unclassified Pseudonocardia]OLL76614.1 Proline-rich protein [Pseudonocardia sp. Ae150A_Ps1]
MAENGTDETIRIDDAVTADYLDGLRSALADLPSAELAEIVEDARGHLADLAGELGEAYDRTAVHERLGAPAAYAAELRAAAGFPAPPGPEPRPRWAARFAVLTLVGAMLFAALGGVIGVPEGGLALILGLVVAGVGVLPVLRDGPRQSTAGALRPVRALDRLRVRDGAPAGEPNWRDLPAFVAVLQPGWWVLRAVVAAGVVAVMLTTGGSTAVLVTVLVSLAAVPLSVALGARSRSDRRLLWAVLPLNVFAAGLVFAAAGALAEDDDPVRYSTPSGLTLDGESITDVRPFDAKGRPLSGVYLFDQDGTPLVVDDYCPVRGRPVADEPDAPGPYPRGTRTSDPRTGECVTTPPAPMVVTIPGATPAPATSASAPPSAPPAPTATPAPAAPRPGG